MTCGSKKHIEEALAKIKVNDLEEDSKEVEEMRDVRKRKGLSPTLGSGY